jgi:hypothetical protein
MGRPLRLTDPNTGIVSYTKHPENLPWIRITGAVALRWVYVLWSKHTGLFKIGKTTDLRRRMNSFYSVIPQDIQLFAFCSNSAITKLEGDLHSIFAERRDKGEWFKLTVNDLALCINQFGFVMINKTLKDFLAN